MNSRNNKRFITACVVWISSFGFSQDIEYAYDNAGNRVLRQAYFMMSNPDNDNALKSGELANQALSDSTGKYSFNLYPNPTHDVLNIATCESFLKLPNKRLQAYDLTGKLIIEQDVEGRVTQLDFSNYITGQYIVKLLSAGKQIKEWKIVRE